ncbi:putative E3 ubiquitin-protein ligase HERC2 [Sesamum angolense]|uniref:E3 ubiquitin-protein ligase HERC2 n=1 Tax=Sesamum angolense TaxID=2727404 RepID=A0AAE2BKK3_9LAMI|nr:putative E3 ubiquitin-protein ligase HERC2 [Sesamum angolense]
MEESTVVNPAHPSNLSRKIVSIAAGEAHTLALTADGKVYSWGRGTFGRLGTGSEEDRHFPVRVSFFGSDDEREDKLKIVGIAAGAYHSLALAVHFACECLGVILDHYRSMDKMKFDSVDLLLVLVYDEDDGSVWAWGYNICILYYDSFDASILDSDTDGQIGVTGENYLIPHQLEGFLGLGSPGSSTPDNEMKSGKPLKISSVKAGAMMSLAIDNLGALWMWGNCPHPSESKPLEGEYSLVSSVAPVPVWNFHGHTVVKVACGNEHVVALVSAGETYEGGDLICYSWGCNNHGQLGMGDNAGRLHPEVIETFNSDSPWEVYEIACGASHTALLTKRKGPSDTLESFCWTFGLGDNGQLGHGTTQNLLSPELVRGLPQSIFLVSVDCVLHKCRFLGKWVLGDGGPGLCPDSRFIGLDAGDALSPLLIPCNGLHDHRFREPLQVACGAAHTVLVADAGYKLWSWGRGRSGVLGNGQTVDCYAPTVVLWPLLSDDFREEESQNREPDGNSKEKNPEESAEIEKRLSAAMEEMKLLQSRLSVMERYVSILHGAVFGKPFLEHEIPSSLQNSGTFDIAKEWENMLDSSDQRKLARLEMFYRDMLAGTFERTHIYLLHTTPRPSRPLAQCKFAYWKLFAEVNCVPLNLATAQSVEKRPEEANSLRPPKTGISTPIFTLLT